MNPSTELGPHHGTVNDSPADRGAIRRRVKRAAVVLVLSLAAGIGGAYCVTLLIPPAYDATASLLITGGALRDATTGQLLDTGAARNLVPTVARLVESDQIARDAAAAAHVPPDAIIGHMSAQYQQDVQLITVTARSGTASSAATIANAVAHTISARMARTPIDAAGTVRALPFDLATPPATPVLPNPLLDCALGALLGLLAGVGIARIRERLDDKVIDIDQVQAVTNMPLLAAIPFDRQVSRQPLISQRLYAPWSEMFGKLRTNLEFAAADGPRLIAVTSAVGGEGKSVTCCNLAIALARAGRTVLLVEADLRRPSCCRYLGVRAEQGLSTVLTGMTEAKDAIQQWGKEGLCLLPAGPHPPNPSELLSSERCRELLSSLRDQYDVVIVDLPSLLPVADAAVVAGMADGVLLLAKHGTRIKQLRHARRALTAVHANVLGCVLTMAPLKMDGYESEYGTNGTPVSDPTAGATMLKVPVRATGGQQRKP